MFTWLKQIFLTAAFAFLAVAFFPAWAQQANLEVNTPAIASLKSSMQSRHGMLAPHYASGAIGLTRDGMVTMSSIRMASFTTKGSPYLTPIRLP